MYQKIKIKTICSKKIKIKTTVVWIEYLNGIQIQNLLVSKLTSFYTKTNENSCQVSGKSKNLQVPLKYVWLSFLLDLSFDP